MRAVTVKYVAVIGDGASGSSTVHNFRGGVVGVGKPVEDLVAMANAGHGSVGSEVSLVNQLQRRAR